MSFENAYMEMIQLHERSWGMEQYPGRPSLAELLNSPVVIMWTGEIRGTVPPPPRRSSESQPLPARFMFSTHQTVDEINEALIGMIVAGKTPPNANRRISRIFVNKKPVKIKGLRLLLADE